MYRVKCLKRFGTWSYIGKIMDLNNNLADVMERRGIVKKIKYLGNFSAGRQSQTNPSYLKYLIESAENRIRKEEIKIEKYKESLRRLK